MTVVSFRGWIPRVLPMIGVAAIVLCPLTGCRGDDGGSPANQAAITIEHVLHRVVEGHGCPGSPRPLGDGITCEYGGWSNEMSLLDTATGSMISNKLVGLLSLDQDEAIEPVPECENVSVVRWSAPSCYSVFVGEQRYHCGVSVYFVLDGTQIVSFSIDGMPSESGVSVGADCSHELDGSSTDQRLQRDHPDVALVDRVLRTVRYGGGCRAVEPWFGGNRLRCTEERGRNVGVHARIYDRESRVAIDRRGLPHGTAWGGRYSELPPGPGGAATEIIDEFSGRTYLLEDGRLVGIESSPASAGGPRSERPTEALERLLGIH